MNICGMNGDTTKHINRRQVLRLLSREPGISRTEIAARMGLVKMTVSNIIAEMLRSGMVIETKATGVEKTGAGRKLTGLCFSDKAPVLAGVQLDDQKLRVGIFSMELKLLKRSESPAEAADIIDQISAAVLALTKNSRSLLGIGLALGHIWNPSLGILLQKKLNLPVFTVCSAAADTYAVARSAEYERFLCLSLSQTDISAAAMVNGSLLGDCAGCIPLGQMIRNNSPLAETVSISAICRSMDSALGIVCRNLSEVQEACRKDPAGNTVLRDVFGTLADTVCNICLAVQPEALVFDSNLSGFGKELTNYFFSRLNVCLGDKAPAILDPVYGNDTTLYGAACLVLEKVFTDTLGYDLFFKE